MKLQNLIIIFIIIIIPIVFIFSMYLNLETETIRLQTDYDGKLIEATKEAMEAFEINTTEWNSEYSTLANSKRQDVMSSINVFTTSLADKLRIGGTTQETILSYVPAIVYIMYDGYYIYSPTHVPRSLTNDNGVQLFYYSNAIDNNTKITASATQNIKGEIVAGEPMYVWGGTGTAIGTYNGKTFTTNIEDADKIYKHVLKTFVPYTTTYGNYVINYTLDNYVRIYGKDESKEGYIIESTDTINVEHNSISGIKFNGENITSEMLTENILVRNDTDKVAEVKTYKYVYNSNNDKRYYDDDEQKFFTVNNSNVKVYLPNTEVGTGLAEYKKIVICTNTSTGEYLELYQMLNSGSLDTTWYKLNTANNKYEASGYTINIERNKDCSAISYYVETYCFNKWLKTKFSDSDISTIVNAKTESIIGNINNNLNLSISNYSAKSGIDYQVPELSAEDWEQALSNISMITFFQGVKIGLKTYNNYVVVSSTHNNEYVSEDSLYYLSTGDTYYHRYGCTTKLSDIDGIYRNTEFKPKSYSYKKSSDDTTYSGYYYKHSTVEASGKQVPKEECFDCIVNRNNLIYNGIDDASYKQSYYIALARERYIQIQKTKLIK